MTEKKRVYLSKKKSDLLTHEKRSKFPETRHFFLWPYFACRNIKQQNFWVICRRKRDISRDEMKKTHRKTTTHPSRPAASTEGPCSTICQSSRSHRHWKLPSTIALPNHPRKKWMLLLKMGVMEGCDWSEWLLNRSLKYWVRESEPMCHKKRNTCQHKSLIWQLHVLEAILNF